MVTKYQFYHSCTDNKYFFLYYLGEKATKWETGENEVDGLTTNGVLIMHPKGQFCPPEGCSDPKPGIWREISVGGCVFGLRESRSAAIQGPPVPSETSVLVDGTLIDLCGATLLWRSAEGKTIKFFINLRTVWTVNDGKYNIHC